MLILLDNQMEVFHRQFDVSILDKKSTIKNDLGDKRATARRWYLKS